MHIIHVNASYKPAYVYGGPSFSIPKLCEVLVKAGEDVEVLTTRANGVGDLDVNPSERIAVDGVPVTYFNRWTKDHSHFSPALLIALNKHLSSSKVHGHNPVVHIHSWWNLVSMFSLALCYIRGTKHIISPKGMLSDYSFTKTRYLFHKLVGKHILKNALIQASSDAEASEVRKVLPDSQIIVIPNLINIPQAALPPSPEQGVFKMLFFSRIHRQKGVEILLAGMDRFDFPFHLDIAGSGDPAYITQLKNSIPSATREKINWEDNPGDEKFRKLSSSDILILPSYKESFANVIIESLSMGTPVIVSRQVGLAGFVEQYNLGWVCDSTVSSLAETICNAYLDNKKRQRIRKEAPAIIRSHFSTDHIIKQYLNMYQNV